MDWFFFSEIAFSGFLLFLIVAILVPGTIRDWQAWRAEMRDAGSKRRAYSPLFLPPGNDAGHPTVATSILFARLLPDLPMTTEQDDEQAESETEPVELDEPTIARLEAFLARYNAQQDHKDVTNDTSTH